MLNLFAGGAYCSYSQDINKDAGNGKKDSGNDSDEDQWEEEAPRPPPAAAARPVSARTPSGVVVKSAVR